jgi:hypothetical protein
VVCKQANLVVEVDPSLAFVGRVEKTMRSKHEATERSYSAQVFVRADAGKNLQALAVVEEATIEHGIWLDESGDRYTRQRYTGEVGGWAFHGMDNIFCKNEYFVERFLREKGYVFPDCLLYDIRLGLVGNDRAHKLSVQYAEPVADDELPEFFGNEFRTEHRIEYVDSFSRRARDLVRILPPDRE